MTRRTPPARRRTAGRLLLLASVACLAAGLVGLVGAQVPATAPATAPTEDSAPGTVTGRSDSRAPEVQRARALLERVRVVRERAEAPGYDRDCGPGDACVFGTSWTDDSDAPSGRNGCDTRNDVLGADLLEVTFKADTGGCKPLTGLLRDPYTGVEIDFATRGSQIHVDHLVPLAAAWDLGAASWTPARRTAFANDTERELLAVSESANLSKGDSTPSQWLPPRTQARCGYVIDYLDVVAHYDLALTRDDARVVREVLRTRCADGVRMTP